MIGRSSSFIADSIKTGMINMNSRFSIVFGKIYIEALSNSILFNKFNEYDANQTTYRSRA